MQKELCGRSTFHECCHMQSAIQCELDQSVPKNSQSEVFIYIIQTPGRQWPWCRGSVYGTDCSRPVWHHPSHHVCTELRTGHTRDPGITQTNWISHLVMHNWISRQSQAIIEAASWGLRGKRCRPYQVEAGLYKEPEWYMNIAVDEVYSVYLYHLIEWRCQFPLLN